MEAVEEADTPAEDIDRDFQLLANLCADGETEDETRLSQALVKARDQFKAQVRRQMGLS